MHIDLYYVEENINLILFELFVLKTLQMNHESIVRLPNSIVFLVEVANTLKNSLMKNLFIFEHFSHEQKYIESLDLNLFEINQQWDSEIQVVLRNLNGIKTNNANNKMSYFSSIDFSTKKTPEDQKQYIINANDGRSLLREMFLQDYGENVESQSFYNIWLFIKLLYSQ